MTWLGLGLYDGNAAREGKPGPPKPAEPGITATQRSRPTQGDRQYGCSVHQHRAEWRRRAERTPARDLGVRAAVVEIRGRQGTGDPRALRHVRDALLPGAE